MEAVARLGQLAIEPSAPGTRAEAALEMIARLTGCDAVSLSTWDPVARTHRCVASHGYSAEELAFGEDPDFLHDDGYRLARRSRWPLRRTDVVARTPPLERIIELPRFGEGLTACLFTRELRYTGMLNYSRVSDEPIDDATVSAIALVGPTLAHLVDVGASVQGAARLLDPAMAAVTVHAGGRVEPLPDRPRSPLLAPGSRLLSVAARATARAWTATFLFVDGDAIWRVVAVRPDDPRSDAAMVVGVMPARTDLTRRELEVLTLIAAGHTNPEIAERLVMSRHTVATHLEHILHKLDVPTRGAAAARAIADGLVLVGDD